MLTRCPACETTFRVTPEQLKVRAGKVRCGECQHVFNALDTLIEEPIVVMAPPPAPEQAPQEDLAVPPAPSVEDGEAESVAATAITPEISPDEQPEPEPDPVPDSSPETLPDPSTATVPESGPEPEPTPEATEPLVEEPEPLPDLFAEPPPPRRWPWVIGVLLALGALSLQLAIAFRVELAVLMPEAKPALVALCDMAGCEVGLPRKVELVGIEASDLHPDTDPAHKGRLALTATLKNRAPFAQEFPHLELTLTDTADKAIARKVLTPADYLPAKTPAAAGMPANGDLAISVGIDPQDLPASGYRLYLFYP